MATVVNAARSDDPRVDGLLSGRMWYGPIAYSDPDSPSDYEHGYHNDGNGNGVSVQLDGFSRLTGDQLRLAHAILSADADAARLPHAGFSVESFTNLETGYIAGGSGLGDLRFANSADPPTAYAYYPGTQGTGGDAWFGPSGDNPVAGNYDHFTFFHEIGHSLGLKHGHETHGFGALPSETDSHEYSLMTYRTHVGHDVVARPHVTNEAWSYPQTFMMHDIAALQHMYGADFTANAGHTTYSWRPGEGTTFVDGQAAIQPGANRIFLTIWDGGGIDTYDGSAYAEALRISLAPGGHSELSPSQLAHLRGGPNDGFARGSVFNALQHDGDVRSLIENAIGGGGGDTLVGNAAANRLTGNDGDDTLGGKEGDDTLSGGAGADRLHGDSGNDTLGGKDGNDVLDGGAGADAMYGDAGDDVYFVDAATDLAHEIAAAGSDTVCTLADFTLGANIEVLTLLAAGTARLGAGNPLGNRIAGNALDNTLRGLAGNDLIEGGRGADILIGGRGNDTFSCAAGASTVAARDIVRAGDSAAAFEKPGAALGDCLDFSTVDADATRTGLQHFVFGTATGKGRLWAVDSGSLTLIRGNNDGDRAAELEVAIEDGAVLAAAYGAADFLV